MPKYLQNAIIAVACNTSSTRQMITLIRLLFILFEKVRKEDQCKHNCSTLTHLCPLLQFRSIHTHIAHKLPSCVCVCAVVEQKGQMVFKQIKQIANYSCYLSLIIGSFFILSLHISPSYAFVLLFFRYSVVVVCSRPSSILSCSFSNCSYFSFFFF